MRDPDYGDDHAPLANTPTQAESFLNRLDRAAGGFQPITLRLKIDTARMG